MPASALPHSNTLPRPDPNFDHDVIVIGGGIAGLVAARDLATTGLRVCLIEAEHAVGGRVQNTSLAGLPVELGAEAFATRAGAVEALLKELGMTAEMVHPNPAQAWVITPQAAHPLPVSGALGIPAHPLAARKSIGLRAALWAAIEPWRPRSTHAPGASVAAVARARIGARATAALVAPVVEGVYSASADTLRFDTQRELARVYARTGSLVRAAREVRSTNLSAGGAVASLSGGLSRLVDRLLHELRSLGVAVHTGSAVTQLVAVPHGDAVPDQPAASAAAVSSTSWRVRWEGGEGRAHAVVLAISPREAGQLMLKEPGVARETNADVPVAGEVADIEVETVTLVVDSPALGDAAGNLAPRGTGALIQQGHPNIAAKALTHATAKWAWLRDAAPAGRHVLRLSYGSRGLAPATANLSDAAAAALALQDAAVVLGVPLDPGQLVAHVRARWRISARVEPTWLPPGLHCTGEAYAGTGLASVVPHARELAREVAREIACDVGRAGFVSARPLPSTPGEPRAHVPLSAPVTVTASPSVKSKGHKP